jgi:NAD(P)H-dependent FMN reductase
MKIAIISGSHRQNSESARVAKYLAARIANLHKGTTTDIIELTGNPLPLWDESMWQAGSDLQKLWQPYADRLKAADGLVVISPEWSGMVPAGLKNFFLYCSAAEVGHKPAMITSVSAGMGGAYPVNELRTSSYKNTKICYIPEHLIVRHVKNIFAGDTPSNDDDKYMRERADYAINELMHYTTALKSVRESGVFFDKKFPFGM